MVAKQDVVSERRVYVDEAQQLSTRQLNRDGGSVFALVACVNDFLVWVSPKEGLAFARYVGAAEGMNSYREGQEPSQPPRTGTTAGNSSGCSRSGTLSLPASGS